MHLAQRRGAVNFFYIGGRRSPSPATAASSRPRRRNCARNLPFIIVRPFATPWMIWQCLGVNLSHDSSINQRGGCDPSPATRLRHVLIMATRQHGNLQRLLDDASILRLVCGNLGPTEFKSSMTGGNGRIERVARPMSSRQLSPILMKCRANGRCFPCQGGPALSICGPPAPHTWSYRFSTVFDETERACTLHPTIPAFVPALREHQ